VFRDRPLVTKAIKGHLCAAPAIGASIHASADESPPGTLPGDRPSAMWTETVTQALDFLNAKAIDFRGLVS
jgi:hypothetical protein